MTFVRNLLADLVAKRLWPVALALVVALVAIPVFLTGSPAEPPAPVAAVPPATGSTPAVSVAEDRPRGGRGPIGRDPFKQRDVAPEVTIAGGNAPGAASTDGVKNVGSGSGSDSGGGSGSTGGSSWDSDVPAGSIPGLDDVDVVPVGGGTGSGPSTGTGSGKAPAKTVKADARDSWTVDLRFGQDGKLTPRTDVLRLSPLPSATDPFFVFLGVLADGKTATFLVSSDAEATGDGKCLPSTENCERVEMKAGDTEFFDVVTPEGETKQYQLDVVRVQRERKATTAVAAAARNREDAAGREVLRAAVETKQVDVSDLAYSRDLGLVLPSGVDQEQSGSLFGGYRVDLRFGAPDALVKRYNLARLTPLPSVEEPSFVYLGVLADGKSALFLNPSEAAASGDAVCDPSPEDCQRVTMEQGDSALFDVADVAGGTTQYQLDIDAITELQAATPEEAAASRSRESKAGRVILRRLINEVGTLVADLNFSPKSGEVVERSEGEEPAAAPTPAKTEEEQAEPAPAPAPEPTPGS